MLIDWFTVVAQAINFLILVWLLKRYLYLPILKAIDEREQRIAAMLADAETKQAEALRQQDEFKQKNADFDQHSAALLTQARLAAEAEEKRLLSEARLAADDFTAKRMATLKNEAAQLNQAITLRTQQAVFDITRKTLTDLAAASLQQQIAEMFIRRLRTLNAETKAVLGRAIQTASEPALLRCSFELPADQRLIMQSALKDIFSTEIPLHFETATDLICGIEFSSNGQKLAWSIADYLGTLAQEVDDLLKQPIQSGTAASADE
jgi:F-type H+-transporting ATPase subunit b